MRLAVYTLTSIAIVTAMLVPHRTDKDLMADLSNRADAMQVVQPADLLSNAEIPAAQIDTRIDRREVLRDLFAKVATGRTDGEKIEKWVAYLQRRIAHPRFPPMHSKTTMVTDPIWILSNRLGQCGQTNRVLVDGLLAAGYRARIVQLATHVAAEGFYDGGWHFLDADWLSQGEFVRRPDGAVASAAEIHDHPEYLAGLHPDREMDAYPVNVRWSRAPYANAFKRAQIGNHMTPYYLVKTATPAQEQDVGFGWDHYRVEAE